MNRDKLLTIRITEEELYRLRDLAGENESTVSNYVLGEAFKGRRESRVGKKDIPGWEVVERGRRDGGIKMRHERFEEAKILYPEDEAFDML